MINFLVLDTSLVERPHLKQDCDTRISYEKSSEWNNKFHQPISWHAYAAAMKGRFLCAPDSTLRDDVQWADCIMLGTNYNPKASQKIVETIRKIGNKCIIGFFHENGDIFQLNAKNIQWLIDFKEFANSCDYFLTYPKNEIFYDLYKGLGIQSNKLVYIPQPYYLDIADNYTTIKANRNGIFIGPKLKDIEIEHRNFIYNILLAVNRINDVTTPAVVPLISFINVSKDSNTMLKKQFETLYPHIQFNVYSSLDYEEYLRMIGTHQYFINADSSFTQGQVDFDALFVGVKPIYEKHISKTDCADLYSNFETSFFNKLYAVGYTHDFNFMKECCSFEVCKKQIEELYQKFKK